MSAGDLNIIVEQEEEEALRGDDDSMGDEIMIEDIEAPSSILIPPKSLSSSDIARRGSEPRILLDQADLKLAHQVDTEAELNIGVKHELSFSSLHKEESTLRKKKDEFVLNDGTGLSSSHAQSRLEQYGYNVLPEKRTPKWYIFLQQLWQPMPLAIWVAVVILAAIELFIDMGILLFIQFANAR